MLTLQVCFQDFQLIIPHIHIGYAEDRTQHWLCCCILCLQLWLISLGMKNRNQTRCLLCLMFSQGRFNLQEHVWLIHCFISEYQCTPPFPVLIWKICYTESLICCALCTFRMTESYSVYMVLIVCRLRQQYVDDCSYIFLWTWLHTLQYPLENIFMNLLQCSEPVPSGWAQICHCHVSDAFAVYNTLHGEHYTRVLTLSGSCAMYAYMLDSCCIAVQAAPGVDDTGEKTHQHHNSSSLWKTKFTSLCCINVEVSLLTSLCNQHYVNKASLDSWWKKQLFIPLWRKRQTLLQQSSYSFSHILLRCCKLPVAQQGTRNMRGTRTAINSHKRKLTKLLNRIIWCV